jgi:hypothetical protein
MLSEDAATISAVSDVVISLSIAQRSLLTYGVEHPVARKSLEKATSAVERAVALRSPFTLRMTPRAVYLGAHCLERNHPIYRAFAERLWRFGVAGLTFHAGASIDDIVDFLGALNQAVRSLATREQAEALLREPKLPHMRVEFLRQLLTHEIKDEVRGLPAGEAEAMWEGLMTQLAALAGPLSPPPRHVASGGGGGGGSPADAPTDYAGAVIGYLRHLQRAQQQEATLQETGFGKSISELIAGINAELRKQLASAALTAPDVTPEELHRFVNLVGYDSLVATLKRLNETGKAVPQTTFRTLSMLAMMQREGGVGPSGASPVPSALVDDTGVARAPDELEHLLDGLMLEDHADSYAPEEYQRILRDAEQHAQKLALGHRTLPLELQLTEEDGERHFALVANELLEGSPDDTQLAETICREAQRSYVRLVDAGSRTGWRQAMVVSRQAGRISRKPGAPPPQWVWEDQSVLDKLRDRLTESARYEAEDTVDHLVAIGQAAVPLLLEVLATSESLSVRRRALAGLEGLPESPTEELVSLLDPDLSWFLHRNVIYLLRRRRDPGGCTDAKALWRRSEPRVRQEIVGYLLAVEDPERLRYLDEALRDSDAEEALATARMVLKQPTRETVTAVARRSEQVPADQVGMPFHMGLLRALAATRHPQALHYVAEVPARRLPVLPWQRKTFRREVEAMVGKAS